MPTNPELAERQLEPINLKHRITGAGVLILFGALVLPWLLGPPSEAKKEQPGVAAQPVPERHSTFEDQVLTELQGTNADFEEPEEVVYVSKITPVNGQAKPEQPVLLEPQKNGNTDQQKNPETTNSDGVTNNDKKPNKPSSDKADKDKPSKATPDSKTDDTKIAKADPKPNKPAVSKPTSAKPKIDVGWVVQVELLIDKNGAKKLVDQLASKGFEPHTTIVDTNRGKNTGTRIWLGPFAQRAEAGAENEKLEAKMGKRGFLRVYP